MIVEWLEIIQIDVGGDKGRPFPHQSAHMGSDRDIARQKSQRIGIAGRLDPQFGDPAQQGLPGTQPQRVTMNLFTR